MCCSVEDEVKLVSIDKWAEHVTAGSSDQHWLDTPRQRICCEYSKDQLSIDTISLSHSVQICHVVWQLFIKVIILPGGQFEEEDKSYHLPLPRLPCVHHVTNQLPRPLSELILWVWVPARERPRKPHLTRSAIAMSAKLYVLWLKASNDPLPNCNTSSQLQIPE